MDFIIKNDTLERARLMQFQTRTRYKKRMAFFIANKYNIYMIIKAYAKLNLSLGITGQRADGYHELDMAMRTIDLHDVISIKKSDSVRFHCGVCDMEQNTAYRAAKIFFAHTGIAGGADISIEKNIPHQAGLGGGSSDGAAVLRGLDMLYGTQLPKTVLEMLALKIGADAPFFVRGGLMRARGIGERLSPAPDNCNFSYLLVKPNAGVDTVAAYREYDLLPKNAVDMDAVFSALAAGDSRAYFAAAGNALYPAAAKLCPSVERLKDECCAWGADFSMMTGSGSCVFSIFSQEARLKAAEEHFKTKYTFVYTAKNAENGSDII